MKKARKRKIQARRSRAGRGALLRRTAPAFALFALAADPRVYAQDAEADGALEEDTLETIHEVVVTSIRQSLETSQDIKRNANVFVDSVTAEDIGALPDRSVTEALQRIPGVAISRFAASNDPDHFSAEGSGVVVRGLTFVRSELNGRDTFTANNGRELSFADVPPELMGGVDVYKNQSAEMVEGGLAGTVNLRTRLPFDSQGQMLAGSFESNYGDFSDKWSPTGSILYSNRWATGAGEFGLLVNGVYSELATRSDGAQASNFRLRTDLEGQPLPEGSEVWVPRGAAFRSTITDRERRGYAAALQWESPDETKVATFQFLRSDARQAWTEHAMETTTDVVGDTVRPVTGTQFEFGDDGVFTRGVITDAHAGWRADQSGSIATNQQNRTSPFGMQHNVIRRDVKQRFVTSDYGLNFKWTPNERWSFNFDAQRVESTVENLDVGLWASVYANVALDLTGSVPDIKFLPPSLTGEGADNAAAYFSDPANYFWRSAMDHIEDNEGEEQAYKIDIARSFEDAGWLESVRFGARAARRDQTARWTTYNWGRVSEIWGNDGPVWFDEPIDGVPSSAKVGDNEDPPQHGVPSAARTYLVTFDDFMRGDVGVPTVAPYIGVNLVDNYASVANYIRMINAEWEGAESDAGWHPLAERTIGDVIPGTPFRPNEINHVVEDTGALYLQLNFAGELPNGMRLGGNVGVRYVETQSEAAGFLAFPVGTAFQEADCVLDPGNPDARPTPFCKLSPEERARVRAYANGGVEPQSFEKTYQNILPSLNLKLALTSDMILRFGFSKAMRRPEMGLLRGYLTHEVVNAPDPNEPGGEIFAGFRGESGNPRLEPMRSTQFDLSWEWYFAPVGSLAISTFYKELKDVITNGFRDEEITNGGETFIVQTRGPVNSDDTGKIKGIELAYQQFYDFLPGLWSGLGVQANYTYIDSDGVPQENLSVENPNGPGVDEPNVDTSLLPLEGLSEHNANFALIYEKGPVSTRLAYSWRSEYLLTTRDQIVPFAPIMSESTGQLDGSFFYTLNDSIKIGVQGVNLLNEKTKTLQVLNDDLLMAPRSWFVNDRRFSVVARMTF